MIQQPIYRPMCQQTVPIVNLIEKLDESLVLPGLPCATVNTTDGGCCVFPFVYKAKTFNACTTEDSPLKHWCAKTGNYDRDKKWGYCLSKLLLTFCS